VEEVGLYLILQTQENKKMGWNFMGQFCFMNQHYLIQPFYSSCSLSFSFGVKLPFIMRDAEIFWADSLAPGAGLAKHHMFWPGDFLRC
jgi:hypothetical protein